MSEATSQNPDTKESEKKLSKKEARKLESQRKRDEEAAVAAAESLESDKYGDVKLKDLQSKEVSGRIWTEEKNLNDGLKDQVILIRGRAQAIRVKGKMAFIVARESGYTVQVHAESGGIVSEHMVKFASHLSRESIVDVEGVVDVDRTITGTTQQVDVHVRNLFCINRASSPLPISIEDAARSESEIERTLQDTGQQLVRGNQDTHPDNRVLDLCTPAKQGIF